MHDKAWLDREEYPFQSRYLDLDVGRLHYVDEGNGASIVMVQGNPTWSFLYRHLIKAFTPAYRCIAMDHIGFGLSDKPPEWTYLPKEHSRHLSTLIETLELDKITLIVQDWGGPIGLSYAINHPENVERLIILNTWMWPVNRDWYYIAFSSFTGGAIGRFLIRHFNFFARVIMPLAYGEMRKLTKHIHRHYLKPLPTPAKRKGSWVLPREILGSTTWLDDLWTRRSALADMPKLIVWGMKDIAFRKKELNVWTKTFPNTDVVRLENVGHYVQEEGAPALEQAIRRFLDSSKEI